MKLSHPGTIAVSFACALLMQPVLAEELVNITEIEGCQDIAAKSERLLCYDTVAEGGVYNEQKLQEVQKESFGNNEQVPEVTIDRLDVTIVKVSRSSSGRYYFYTEDGQAWKQSTTGRWTVKAPFQAEIKTGMMGSFFLVTEGGKSERVKRVK